MKKMEQIQRLYIRYTENVPIDDPVLWGHYEQLRKSVACLPSQMREEILCAAEKLASYQEQQAFRAGMQKGLSRASPEEQ